MQTGVLSVVAEGCPEPVRCGGLHLGSQVAWQLWTDEAIEISVKQC